MGSVKAKTALVKDKQAKRATALVQREAGTRYELYSPPSKVLENILKARVAWGWILGKSCLLSDFT